MAASTTSFEASLAQLRRPLAGAGFGRRLACARRGAGRARAGGASAGARAARAAREREHRAAREQDGARRPPGMPRGAASRGRHHGDQPTAPPSEGRSLGRRGPCIRAVPYCADDDGTAVPGWRTSAYGIGSWCLRCGSSSRSALVVVSHRLGDNTNDNLSLPGTDSQRATDTLAASFPDQANGTSPIVLHAPSGRLTEARYSQAVERSGRRGREGAERRVGRQPAHARGRVGAQQGPDHRLPVGDAVRSARASSRRTTRSGSSTRPRPRARRGCRWRRAGSSGRRCPSPPPSRARRSGSSPRW